MTGMLRLHPIVVVAALSGAAAVGHAQAPAERAALAALRDSLARLTDSAAVRREEQASIAITRARRDDPFLHLRLGFIAYRLGELGAGKPSYDDAAGEFAWATELRPEWPYPWYGLGLSELALGEHAILAIENLRQMLGRDYLSKAAKAFARAAQADPSFAVAVVDLANTALSQRVQPRLQVALEAVRLAAASAGGRDPGVQLARGRIEREAGEVDSALAGFRAALANGADSGVALLELARTQFHAHEPVTARQTYFAGARTASSPAALALYRDDLQWTATPEELAAYDALQSGERRAEWLRVFWSRRDVADARDEGERLAEHYRRWFHARKSFRLVSRHRHYDITEVYRSGQVEFDDRGVIYLRHGEPDRRARFVCPPGDDRCAANESWLYRRPTGGGDLVFHFVARDDVQDYKLVESLVDVFGFQAGVRAAGSAFPELLPLYQSREAFGDLYRRVGGGSGSPGPALSEERRHGKRSIAAGTTSDSYPQRFELPLDAVVSDFVVTDRAESSSTTLHVLFAIPAERLTPHPAPDGVVYPLRFRILVADSAGRQVARLDTTRVFGARQPLRRPAYLTGRLALPVPAGALHYRALVAAVDGSAGEVVSRDSLAADTLDGRRFAASDLVVGVRGSGLAWVRGADTLPLNPLGNVPANGELEVYYQVFGLGAGAPYRTEIEVARDGGRSLWSAIGGLFGGRRAPVRLAFDAAASGSRTEVRRTVSLRGVARGAYRLTVRLTDPARGLTLVRTYRFSIVAR
jgi:GWxTD domain-containing protein